MKVTYQLQANLVGWAKNLDPVHRNTHPVQEPYDIWNYYMTHSLRSSCAIFALCVSAIPALADITADEFLDEYIALTETFGSTVTIGERTMAGDTLNVRDFAVQAALPDDDGQVEVRIDWMKIQQITADLVVVTMAPKMIFSTQFDDGGDSVSMIGTFEQQGLALSVSGPKDQRKYAYQANSFDLRYDDIVVDGEALPMDFSLTMQDIDGEYLLDNSNPEILDLEGAIDMGSVGFNFDFVDPTGEAGHVIVDGNISGLAFGIDTTIVPIEDDRNPLADGLAVVLDLEYSGSEYAMSGGVEDEAFDVSGSDQGGGFAFEISPELFHYSLSSKGLSYLISSGALPIPPVQISFADIEFGLSVPLAKTESPQEFSFLTSIQGLTVSDDLWNILDGGKTLPRDPADFIVDVVGSIGWLVNLVDQDAFDDLGDDTPVEIYDVDIRDVAIKIAGAELLADGFFVFDNTKTELFDGLPQPEGAIEITLSGAYTLLDRLTALGLVEPDMGMGARMMMGLFARPGDGPDQLVSKVEILPDGSIVANGQKLQ